MVSPLSKSMRYSRLTLQFFDEEFERRMNRAYHEKTRSFSINALLLAMFFYGLFAILDYGVAHPYLSTFLLLRFGIAIPSILVALILLKEQNNFLVVDIALSSVFVITALCAFAMVCIVGAPIGYLYYSGLVLIFMVGYGLLRIRFIWACVAGMILFVSNIIVTATIGSAQFPDFLGISIFILSATLIGLTTNYYFELHAKREILLTMRLTDEKDYVERCNRDLESLVLERTGQLRASHEELKERHVQLQSLYRSLHHELQTPLSTIGGYIDSIQEAVIDGDTNEALTSLEIVRKATSNLSRQVKKLDT